MDVSVIIVSRNTRELLLRAVASVYEGSRAVSKEVIVVDNGSTDDSCVAVPARFPEVIYLAQSKNLGFSRANNLGAARARGNFLLLLNSDARLQPDSLQQAVDWMKTRADCGGAGAQLLNPDGSRQNSIANFPTLATELLNKSLLRRLFPQRFPGKETSYPEPRPVESIIGAFFLIRAQLWRDLGGLDERYFFFLEETDFCRRLQQKGHFVFHLPQVRVWHDQGQTARTVPLPARIEYWRSRYTYFSRHHTSRVGSILRGGLLLRLMFNFFWQGIICLFSLGMWQKMRNKQRLTHALLLWHRRGCPREMGLSS